MAFHSGCVTWANRFVGTFLQGINLWPLVQPFTNIPQYHLQSLLWTSILVTHLSENVSISSASHFKVNLFLCYFTINSTIKILGTLGMEVNGNVCRHPSKSWCMSVVRMLDLFQGMRGKEDASIGWVHLLVIQFPLGCSVPDYQHIWSY